MDNFLNSNKQEYNLGNNNQLILVILQVKTGNIWFSLWNGGGVWRYDGKDFKNFLPSEDYYKENQDKRNFSNPQGTFGNGQGTSCSPSQDNITGDMITPGLTPTELAKRKTNTAHKQPFAFFYKRTAQVNW